MAGEQDLLDRLHDPHRQPGEPRRLQRGGLVTATTGATTGDRPRHRRGQDVLGRLREPAIRRATSTAPASKSSSPAHSGPPGHRLGRGRRQDVLGRPRRTQHPRANLDGTSVEVLWAGATPSSPPAVALDVAAGKMYWSDTGQDQILRRRPRRHERRSRWSHATDTGARSSNINAHRARPARRQALLDRRVGEQRSTGPNLDGSTLALLGTVAHASRPGDRPPRPRRSA